MNLIWKKQGLSWEKYGDSNLGYKGHKKSQEVACKLPPERREGLVLPLFYLN